MIEGKKSELKDEIIKAWKCDNCEYIYEKEKEECPKCNNHYRKRASNLGVDPHFYRRLLVLSNHGVQIMRDVEEKDKCNKCSKDKFCPRGPYQDVCIKFADIKSVINFA